MYDKLSSCSSIHVIWTKQVENVRGFGAANNEFFNVDIPASVLVQCLQDVRDQHLHLHRADAHVGHAEQRRKHQSQFLRFHPSSSILSKKERLIRSYMSKTENT